MGTTTKLTFEQFQQMPEREATTYELDEGELLMTPSPTPWHNIVRYRLRRSLTDFVQTHSLGVVLDETDFRLAPETVRKPDLAYLNRECLKNFDPDHSPIECAPSLAVEVISPSNLARIRSRKCGTIWLPEVRRCGLYIRHCDSWKCTIPAESARWSNLKLSKKPGPLPILSSRCRFLLFSTRISSGNPRFVIDELKNK